MYTELREKELQEAGMCDPDTGAFRYPNTHKPSISIPEFIVRYSSLEAGARVADTEVCVAGRLASKRDSSSKLIFYDLVGSDVPEANTAAEGHVVPQIQLMASRAAHTGPAPAAGATALSDTELQADFKRMHHALKKGDVVWARGIPSKSKVGQLSLLVKEVQLLTPCWHEIPLKLTEPNIRYRQRYLDCLVNRPVLGVFALRARVLSALRAFMSQRGFTEVETPILWTSHGGATAKPFRTSSTALGSTGGAPTPLYLRIAPELFLKQLVIGGLDRVFEVSKVFRNEGMDPTHNPEFTTCEFYMAYADYQDLMAFTEAMLPALAQAAVAGANQQEADGAPKKHLLRAPNKFTQELVDIDLAATPYRRIDVMDGLREALKESEPLPDPNDDANIGWYLAACQRVGVEANPPHTLPRVLDALIGGLLEPQCVQPTFLINHPTCLSPLSRPHPTRPGLTERFELFINGAEYVNAYSELNDPAEQRRRMEAQARALNAGDEEAQPVDADFCTALEYGLPPTAGWGLGIDRLVMLLAGQTHIRDVLMFPVMKPQTQAQKQPQQPVTPQPAKPVAKDA